MGITKYIRALASDTIVYGIARAVSAFVGLFLIPLYTRIFSPSEYGLIALITSLVGLLSTFVVLGMDNSSARWFYDTDELSRRKSVIATWFWCQFTIALATAVIIFLSASQISELLLSSSEYANLIRIVAWTIPLSTFGKVLGNWLRYQKRAWMTTIYFSVNSLLSVGLIFIFVFGLEQKLIGLYTAQVISSLVAALFAIGIVRLWILPYFVSWQLLKEMLIFGFPLMPAAIASWITASADRFILQMYYPTSEVGLYAVAVSLSSVIALITSAFQMAWGPFAYSIHNEPKSLHVYSKVLSIYSWLGCWIGTTLSIFAPILLYIFTTPQYYSSASIVSWLIFSHLAVGAAFIGSIGCGIVKKSTPIAISIFIGAGINILLNFALIPSLGKEGAAIATLVAYIFAAVYLFSASQKLYPIPYKFKDAVLLFCFSWFLILLDHLIVPDNGWMAFSLRVSMCLLFIPLALFQRIFVPKDVMDLIKSLVPNRGFGR